MNAVDRRCPSVKTAGFTLLEMMLVVFLVGIIAALAMPNLVLQDDSQKLRKSAEKLLLLMELQGEEAILTGTQRGLRVLEQEEDGEISYHYRWMIWSAEESLWQSSSDQARKLDGMLEAVGDFILLIEDRPVELEDEREKNDKDNKDSKDKPPTPQIILFSSGDVTDFQIDLVSTDGESSLSLTGSYEGIALRDEDDDVAAN